VREEPDREPRFDRRSCARAEARLFVEQLRAHRQPLAGFLVNRCLVAPVDSGDPGFGPNPGLVGWEEAVAALRALPAHQRARVAVQEANIADLAGLSGDASGAVGPAGVGTGPPIWRIPDLGESVHDLGGIIRISNHVTEAVSRAPFPASGGAA
jgi:hypothetical protein